MSKVFSTCTVDVLHIFSKTLCFFQNVGVFEAYNFSHTNVNYNSNFEKYLQGFISILEELKLILDRLYSERNKTLSKTHEYSLNTSDNYTGLENRTSTQNCSELQNSSSNLQNYAELQNNPQHTTGQNYTELQNTSRQQNFTELQNSSSQNFSELHSNNNQLITNHDDLNEITFSNNLLADSTPLVSHQSAFTINTDGHDNKITNNEYIDHPTSGLTPGSQLISSAIESFVQETSHQEDEDDPLNSEDITFRSLDIVNQSSGINNSDNRNCDNIISNNSTTNRNSNNNENLNSQWNESIKNSNENSSTEYDSLKIEGNEKKRFTCNVCNKTLSSKSSLGYHITTIHTGLKPFCCEHCGKLFTTNTNLNAHLTRQHNLNTESANACSECGKLFVRQSALNVHRTGHNGVKPFSCYICGKSFTQKVTCDTHVLTHTRDYPFSCDVCSKRFTTKSKLNYHQKNHAESQYSCSLCEKQFSTRQYLNAHYKLHNITHTEAAPCCLDTVSESSRTQIIEESRVTCPQCDLTFRSQRALTRHTKAKHNPLTQWYHCNVPDCSRPVKSFATRQQLNKHNKRHHTGQKRKYTCNTCGKEFTEKFSLLHHERQNHTAGLSPRQLKPYACHICPKRFTMKNKLNAHIKTHTQEPKFTCNICSKSFYRKDSFSKHKLKHSSIIADQPPIPVVSQSIPCARCGKMFKSKNALMYHLQSHDGNFQFTCMQCGKKFARKCHYEGHLTSHSTERAFKCTTCGRNFKYKKHLRDHIKRVHTSEVGLTMQSLFDTITNDDALTTTQHTYHVMNHLQQPQTTVQPPQPQNQPQPTQVQSQTNNCLNGVNVPASFVLNPAAFQQFQSSSTL